MKLLVGAFSLFSVLGAQAVTPAAQVSFPNGFYAYTNEAATSSSLSASGFLITTGLFSGFDSSSGVNLNPLVYVDYVNPSTGVSDLFTMNGLAAQSFYGFDPVNVSVYGSSGLLGSFSVSGTSVHPELSFTGVDYFTVTSSFPLGVQINTATLTNVAAVPEPESYAMLLAGLGMLGAVSSRKKRQGK